METQFPDSLVVVVVVVVAAVQADWVEQEATAEQAAPPVACPVAPDRTDKTASCSTEGPAAEAVVAAATARAACPATAAQAATGPTATSPSTGSLALPAPQAPPVNKAPREVRKGPRGK